MLGPAGRDLSANEIDKTSPMDQAKVPGFCMSVTVSLLSRSVTPKKY